MRSLLICLALSLSAHADLVRDPVRATVHVQWSQACTSPLGTCRTSTINHGSGVVVGASPDRRYVVVLSAGHVFRGCPPRTIVTAGAGSATLQVALQAPDTNVAAGPDVAIMLSQYCDGLPYAPLAETDAVAGDRLTIYGFPGAVDKRLKVTSALGLVGVNLNFRDYLTEGASGGPVVNQAGEVVALLADRGDGLGTGPSAATLRQCCLRTLGYVPSNPSTVIIPTPSPPPTVIAQPTAPPPGPIAGPSAPVTSKLILDELEAIHKDINAYQLANTKDHADLIKRIGEATTRADSQAAELKDTIETSTAQNRVTTDALDARLRALENQRITVGIHDPVTGTDAAKSYAPGETIWLQLPSYTPPAK